VSSDPLESAHGAAPPPREIIAAAGVLARGVWFAVGVLVGIAATLVATRVGRSPRPEPSARGTYEALPLADNSGVCQEFVALSSLRTTYADALATARRIGPALPPPLQVEHLRVVRAIAPGEQWTLALDDQPGAGSLARAQQDADLANAMTGTGLRWRGVFYGARELFDAAGVLCMPRQGAGADGGR
jgi:hypothetical protein